LSAQADSVKLSSRLQSLSSFAAEDADRWDVRFEAAAQYENVLEKPRVGLIS
jgi:hypothetical protein